MTNPETGSFYPLRVTHEKFSMPDFQQRIELSEEERQEIVKFEGQLYSKLEKIKETTISPHIIYPDAFTTPEGSKVFYAAYVDKTIWEPAKKGERTYEQVFEEVVARSGDEDFLPDVTTYTLEEVERVFFKTDLRSVNKDIRKAVNNYSSRYAESKFSEAFWDNKGDITKVDAPYRIGKIIEPTKLLKKIGPEGYHGFKADIKALRREIKEAEPSEVNKAKLQILQMYQWHINTQLADLYIDARLIAERPTALNGTQKKVLREVPGIGWHKDLNARSVARLDRFLTGVGEGADAEGVTLPYTEEMDRFSAHISEQPSTSTVDSDKYEEVKINAEQAKRLGDLVLRHYGFYGDDKEGWKVVALPERRVTTINSKRKEVQIATNFDRSIISTLTLMAEEVEGHVLSKFNQKAAFAEGINLGVKTYMGGNRYEVLQEAAGDIAEEGTRKMITGKTELPKNRYMMAIKEKMRGGNFSSCYQVIFESRLSEEPVEVQRNIFNDKETFDDLSRKVFATTRRIFGHHTSLSGDEHYIQDTADLRYLEQALLVDRIANAPQQEVLQKLIFMNGVDIQSAQILMSLGFLDLDKVQLPKYVIGRKIWPVIKEALDNGKSVEEAISEAEKLATP